MNAVNAVQLFVLVLTFTVFCQADEDISVSCEDVTGTVGEEVTFTCSVSLKKSNCCIQLYKFQYPEKYNDSEICREDSSCIRRNSFTCRFSPTTVMTGQFRFFVQTTCGNEKTEFTVNITEKIWIKSEPDTEAPDSNTAQEVKGTEIPEPVKHFGSIDTVIAAVMGCFIFIIIMIAIYKKKPNCCKSHGFQRIFLCHKHEDNNSNFQEQNPENMI